MIFLFKRVIFQVVATSFRGSICWWKRGRNWEKLGDDALGVPGGKMGFCGMLFYCSSFSGKKIRVFGETCEFPFRFKLQTTNQNAFLQWKLQRNPVNFPASWWAQTIFKTKFEESTSAVLQVATQLWKCLVIKFKSYLFWTSLFNRRWVSLGIDPF